MKVLNQELPHIQATIEYEFTLQPICDMIRTYSQLLFHLKSPENLFFFEDLEGMDNN